MGTEDVALARRELGVFQGLCVAPARQRRGSAHCRMQRKSRIAMACAAPPK